MWDSRTKQFPPGEIDALEFLDAEMLVVPLRASAPVVIVRALAELRLHELAAAQLDERLTTLLLDQSLTARWRDFDKDLFVNDEDRQYARDLEQQLLARSLQPVT